MNPYLPIFEIQIYPFSCTEVGTDKVKMSCRRSLYHGFQPVRASHRQTSRREHTNTGHQVESIANFNAPKHTAPYIRTTDWVTSSHKQMKKIFTYLISSYIISHSQSPTKNYN
ncbi:hypothetical protein ONS95_006451 [Cadophora gregata]|uniref:uncharacterized protein n=1 Tax=Cadophora gregata TaxID=51156 RepID=UPI0026DC4C0D|nr:uncharacterized protein ONS95_006451 [Cadophora gregata]KAK0101272.1 hypothetical protein ONS95_006451 [Cadophora gregata]